MSSINKISLIIGVILASASFHSEAKDFFLRASATGADTGTDWHNAWSRTTKIQWGTGPGMLGAGDTLWIAGGTYGTLNLNYDGGTGSRVSIRRADVASPLVVATPGWISSFDSQVVIVLRGSSSATEYDINLHGNWFIRSEALGASNGQDWNNAWSLANLNWDYVHPGDTIWLAGGNYTNSLRLQKSGAAGNLIYFKRVRATDSIPTNAPGWNSAFDSQVIVHPPTAIPCLWNQLNVGSFLYFDGRVDSGISFRVNADTANYAGAVSIYYGSGGQRDITFTNIDMAGPAPNSAPFPRNIYDCALTILPLSGGQLNSVSNILVSHCRLHGGANIVLAHHAEALTIENCKLYDNNVAGDPATQPHANVIEFHSGSNFTLRNSEIYAWSVEGFRPYENCSNIFIYGNLWRDPVQPNVARVIEADSLAAPAWGPLFLYNNTFVNIASPSSGWNGPVFSRTVGVGYQAGSKVRNNIIWTSTLGDGSNGAIPPDSDFNYADSNLGEAHSINGAGQSPFVDFSNGNYRIISTISSSLPRNKGATLGNPFSPDADGNTRGADGNWDIGAFESVTP